MSKGVEAERSVVGSVPLLKGRFDDRYRRGGPRECPVVVPEWERVGTGSCGTPRVPSGRPGVGEGGQRGRTGPHRCQVKTVP